MFSLLVGWKSKGICHHPHRLAFSTTVERWELGINFQEESAEEERGRERRKEKGSRPITAPLNSTRFDSILNLSNLSISSRKHHLLTPFFHSTFLINFLAHNKLIYPILSFSPLLLYLTMQLVLQGMRRECKCHGLSGRFLQFNIILCLINQD